MAGNQLDQCALTYETMSSGQLSGVRALLESSPLFDPQYYLRHNPDVIGDPLDHWLDKGWRQGRRPSADFDPAEYLAVNPDVAAAGENPLVHWIEHGQREGRHLSPEAAQRQRNRAVLEGSPLFDPEYYRDHNPDVTGDPLDHWLNIGCSEGRWPCARFDPLAYLAANPDVAAAGENPLVHWIEHGRSEGRLRFPGLGDPVEAHTNAVLIRKSGCFDAEFYVHTYPDVKDSYWEPLEHYVVVGWRQMRSPCPSFDPYDYLKANPDISTSQNPFVHWIVRGRGEQRLLRPVANGVDQEKLRGIIQSSGLFDPENYTLDNLDILIEHLDPLEHYLTKGWKHRLRPSAEFDVEGYLKAHPELESADRELISYYFLEGIKKGHQLPLTGIPRGRRDREVQRVKQSGLFDACFYVSQCPLVKQLNIDPALHYVVSGYRYFFDPSPTLSASAYAARSPKFRTSDQNLVSFILDNPRDVTGIFDENATDLKWKFEAGVQLPDGIVHFERMEGIKFFGRHGFRFVTDGESSQLLACVNELSTTVPALTLGDSCPDLSIVIPIYGQTHFVLGCLHSLAAQQSRYSAEIIAIDDVSPPSARTELLGNIPWIRYVRREANGGFIEACNDGGNKSRGKFIVFLNSDTRVAAGWLDELIDTFHNFPKAGLVGSKLFNGDVSLQEAGGILWNDGSAWNYGRGANPNDPRYCFARQVDYCSGASIAVSRDAWTRADGFSRDFAPAYYEDVDLAFRLRYLGYETWFQSLSRVLHYEGKTHGHDVNVGVKSYQVSNQKLIASRYSAELAKNRDPGVWPDDEAIRARKKRMLIFDASTPTPDRDAGSDLTAKIITVLQRLGYAITFIPQDNYLYQEGYSDALNRIGVEVAYAPFQKNVNDVLHYRDHKIELCLVFRHTVFQKVYETLRSRLRETPLIFHNVDLHFLREQREAELDRSPARMIRASSTMTGELSMIALADATIVTNSEEQNILGSLLPIDNIVLMPYIAEASPSTVPFQDRRGILFLGGFRHPPNEDAVRFFITRIWPRLMQELPNDTVFTVIGAYPSPELLSLAGDRVEVVGYVEDLKPYFDRARVFVAPLRYGAGVKGKVIQSLRYGLPAVVTSVAAEGISLNAGEHVLVDDDPDAFVESVIKVYRDPVTWSALQNAGYRYIDETTSWAKATASCESVIALACQTWLAREEQRRSKIVKGILEGSDDGTGNREFTR